ncbi:Cell death protease [Physocladia obscura]|uniref:Cell death protease n=1 Tax=Physocladia obscura TaxID=109957 RepID=A0AAD5SWU2_9FUNG|nr:Cell death protease [Physocladia obscura]
METPTIAVPMHMENTEGLRSTGQQNQHNQYNNSQHSNSKGSNIHSNNHNIHLRSAQPQIASAQTPPFGQRNFAGSERAHIAATLRKAVGPEFLAQRAGPGGSKLVYIPGNRVISLANDVFGFDGWSHSILGSEIDFCDTSRDGLISLGISTIVRVTLKDGTSHEDVGYGSIENARSKGTAFDKVVLKLLLGFNLNLLTQAKKESVTDAIKRALRSFGNVMGNCTYNTELTKKIIQMPKIPPPIYDASNIYRGEEYMEGGFKAIAMAAAAASIASESAKKMTVQQSIDREKELY